MANSKAVEQTGHYWSQRTLENTGSVTPEKYRWLVAVLGILCFFVPFLIAFGIYYFGDPSDQLPEFTPVLLMGLIIGVCAICGLILIAATLQLFRRIFFPPKPHKKL
ncbi:MAG: hypothetical protein AAGI14_11925 [Pseudomonadota bacterium]